MLARSPTHSPTHSITHSLTRLLLLAQKKERLQRLQIIRDSGWGVADPAAAKAPADRASSLGTPISAWGSWEQYCFDFKKTFIDVALKRQITVSEQSYFFFVFWVLLFFC